MTAPDLAAEIEAERQRVRRKANPPKPESAEHRERRLAIASWKGTASGIWWSNLHYLTDEELLWFVPRFIPRSGQPMQRPTADEAVRLRALDAAIRQRQEEERQHRHAAVDARLQRLGLPAWRFWS